MPVPIINDEVLEVFIESFMGNLETRSGGIPNSVALSPDQACAKIVDNDGMIIPSA